MAHSRSARKRIRQNLDRRSRSRNRRSRLRTQIKKLRTAIQSGDVDRVQEVFRPTLRLVDVSCARGVMHANAAARTKSRLARQAQQVLDTQS